MSINIQEYEKNLNAYNQQITAKKNEIANAERELIVAQTQLKNYEQQAKSLEEECLQLTGKPISELENVIAESMAQLDKIMSKVTSIAEGNQNGTITESEIQDASNYITQTINS